MPAHVDDDACTFLLDPLHGGVELAAAVATAGGKDVARQALAVNPDKDGGVRADFPFHERDVVSAVQDAAVEMKAEAAEIRGHVHFLHFFNEALTAAAVGDEVGDAAKA